MSSLYIYQSRLELLFVYLVVQTRHPYNNQSRLDALFYIRQSRLELVSCIFGSLDLSSLVVYLLVQTRAPQLYICQSRLDIVAVDGVGGSSVTQLIKRFSRAWCRGFHIYYPVLQIRIRIRSDPVFSGHPDPDPGKYQNRIRILYPQKDPFNLIFLVKYHCLKYSFVHIIFILDFKCHKMIRFGKKMP